MLFILMSNIEAKPSQHCVGHSWHWDVGISKGLYKGCTKGYSKVTKTNNKEQASFYTERTFYTGS